MHPAKAFNHEIDRITQFKEESRDQDQFYRKLCVRAGRCSQEKLQRFVHALRLMKLEDLASMIEFTYVKS